MILPAKCFCGNEDHVKENRNFSLNRVVQFDPTRTLTVRSKFVRDMVRRFKKLKQSIRKAIIEDDMLGAKSEIGSVGRVVTNAPFEYRKSASKLKAFKKWLEGENQKFILSRGGEGIQVTRVPGSIEGLENQWTDTYIQSAYQKGMVRGRRELIKAGVDLPSLDDELGGIRASFNQPFHAERVGLAYTRTYEVLEGVTKTMSSQMSQVLASGMAEGRSPREIAESLNDRVDKIGITRAKTIARTEVIRAHHDANIAEYERAGISGVTVKAEWVTAGFNVCPICEANEGSVFTIQEMRGLIPVHPNCRCVAVPIVESDKKFKSVADKIAVGIKKGAVQFKELPKK